MASQQQNAWQNARPRHSQSASRTPQSRSGTGSPQHSNPTQSPRQDRPPQQSYNVWTQRGGPSRERQNPASNGKPEITSGQAHAEEPVNGFNNADARAFLSRDIQAVIATYKLVEATGAARTGGNVWGAKANHMANNQPFFVHLARQVASLENGG